MKAVLLALIVALAAAPRLPQTPPAGLSATGSIEVVVKRNGGAPLDDVDVTLTGPEASPWMITTGKDGRALFRNLPPGKYQVLAERQGYMTIRSDGAAVTAYASVQLDAAAPGATARLVRLLLTPEGIISGKVEDSNGRPLRGVSITPARAVYMYGRRTLMKVITVPNLENLRTDDLGEFRIFWLPPGEYYILANRESREADDSNTYTPTVYYPGTPDLKTAAVAKVREGQETRADIVFRSGGGVTISGAVASPFLISPGRTSMYLNPVVPELVSELGSNAVAPTWGGLDMASQQFHFEIHGVPPGTYDLFIVASRDDVSQVSGRYRLEVGNTKIDGVVVTLRKSTDIRGKFSVSNDLRLFPNPESPPWLSGGAPMGAMFAATGRLADQSNFSVRTGEDGQVALDFLTSGVTESRYRIAPTWLPRDVYLVDLRQDGRSIFNDGVVEVGIDTVNLELVLGRNGGVVSGKVTIPATDDAPAFVAVALIPDRPRRSNPILYKRQDLMALNSGASVTFSFSGVAPGSYRILALDNLWRGDEMNPDFLAQYEQRGVAINLEAGASVTGIIAPLIRTGK